MKNATCICHPERIATGFLDVSCAPGGQLPVCADCFRPEARQAVFDAYRANHDSRIQAQKRREMLLKIMDTVPDKFKNGAAYAALDGIVRARAELFADNAEAAAAVLDQTIDRLNYLTEHR